MKAQKSPAPRGGKRHIQQLGKAKTKVPSSALRDLALLGGAYDVPEEAKELINERLHARARQLARTLQVLRMERKGSAKTITPDMVSRALNYMGAPVLTTFDA